MFKEYYTECKIVKYMNIQKIIVKKSDWSKEKKINKSVNCVTCISSCLLYYCNIMLLISLFNSIIHFNARSANNVIRQNYVIRNRANASICKMEDQNITSFDILPFLAFGIDYYESILIKEKWMRNIRTIYEYMPYIAIWLIIWLITTILYIKLLVI